MISFRKFNSATKFLLLLAPILFVSGCTTVSHSPYASSKAAALAQAEPGPERLLRYCRRMADTNNLRIAIGVCKRALETAPDNPAPVLALAEAYLSAQKEEEAAEAYRFALSIDATSSAAHFGLGKLYLKKSQLADAGPHLEAALSAADQDPAIYNALGVLKDQLGDHVTAQSLYRSGLVIDPENTALSNNLGVSLLLSERLSEGMTVLGSVSAQQRPNEVRRQNLAAAQEAIAAVQLASEEPEGEFSGALKQDQAFTGSLRNIRTVSAPTEKTINHAQAPKPQLSKVEARPSAPPKGSVIAPTITAAPYQPQKSVASAPVVLDSLAHSQDLGLEPTITPAPVTVVDFQELPPLQPKTAVIEAARAIAPQQDVVLVESLPDLPDTLDVKAPQSSFDLASISPRRKPLAPKAIDPSSPASTHTETILAEKPETEAGEQIIIADVPHLPIASGTEDQGALEERDRKAERDQRAERSLAKLSLAEAPVAAPKVAAWDDAIEPGDEFLIDLKRIQTASLTPPKSTEATHPSKTGKATIFEEIPAVSTPSEGTAQPTPSQVRDFARRHQGNDAGLDGQAPREPKRGSDSQTPPDWPFDLASLPASPDHGDGAQDQDPPRNPEFPLLDWPNFIAIRETPPLPEPEPSGERLLALMMIQRESFSTA